MKKSKKVTTIIIITLITALSGLLTTAITALANPELVRVIVDAIKNTPTATLVAPTTATVLFQPSLTPVPSLTLAAPTLVPPQPTCDWIPYLDGKALPSERSCLDDLISYGIFKKSDKIVFAVERGRDIGLYGICTDISSLESLKFHVGLNNDLASARFLVSISPKPIPSESSYAIRFQAEESQSEKELYLKLVEYTASGFADDKDVVEAISLWQNLNVWGFDFDYQFSGPKVHTLVNLVSFTEGYQPYSSRYLCFSYQSMPTSEQAAHLDVTITLP